MSSSMTRYQVTVVPDLKCAPQLYVIGIHYNN